MSDIILRPDRWVPGRAWASRPAQAGEYLLPSIFATVACASLPRSRKDFTLLKRGRVALFVLCLFAAMFANPITIIWLRETDTLSALEIPFHLPHLFILLFAMLPTALVGAQISAGPALVTGLVLSNTKAFVAPVYLSEALFWTFLSYIVGWLLHQHCDGALPALVCQPWIGMTLATALSPPLLFLVVFSHVVITGLAGVDHAVNLVSTSTGPLPTQTGLAALLLHAIHSLFPHVRPAQTMAPHSSPQCNLRRQLLTGIILLGWLADFTFVMATAKLSLHLAVRTTVDGMEQAASSAAEGVTSFIQVGQEFLTACARREELQATDDRAKVERTLKEVMNPGGFFSTLILFDQQDISIAAHRSSENSPVPPETALLMRSLETDFLQVSPIHHTEYGKPFVPFTVPPRPENTGPTGALLGRTRPDVNPIPTQTQRGLSSGVSGESFILDESGRIVSHRQMERLATEWHVDTTRPPLVATALKRAYESRDLAKNTPEIVYYLPCPDYPWAVVIRAPYSLVLTQAAQIAVPLIILICALIGAFVLGLSLVAIRRFIQPLASLLAAAERIANGNLDQPVHITGLGKATQLGRALEHIRVRFKWHLEDLNFLLQISQSASATLDLSRGLSYILEGVLRATTACVARVVLLDAEGRVQNVFARGSPREGLDVLDRMFAASRRLLEPLVLENVEQAHALLGTRLLETTPLQAALIVPIRVRGQASAVLWLGYSDPHPQDASEIQFISGLAGQVAVLLENTRRFQVVEDQCRHLAAILESTSDPILAIDANGRILLFNPSAERTFGLPAQAVVGKPIDEAPFDNFLRETFTHMLSAREDMAREIPLPDGRTLLANSSLVIGPNGEQFGHVVIMRDITSLKQLEQMKSEFVATVSQDLRAPLTFIRGYAAMLPMVGTLNEQQREYLHRILHGVEQMTELVNNLLDLDRIEAGMGIERAPCHLGPLLAGVVESLRTRAASKNLTLRLEPADRIALVTGDAALLKQALANVVDNTIKHTPPGGKVTVGVFVHDDQAVIYVTGSSTAITPNESARMLDESYRARQQESTQIPGTGLSLAIVKSIVERHKGRVWIKSDPNLGSTFYIALPLRSETSGTNE